MKNFTYKIVLILWITLLATLLLLACLSVVYAFLSGKVH